MDRVYEAINGQRIEFAEPAPEVANFLQRVVELAKDPATTSNTLIALVYSQENPILDKTIFPTRGAVTKEVIDNPIYSVLTDIIFRKEVEEKGVSIESLAARYTLTVTEAAEQLKVHPTSIQKAIAARRLPVWVKGNKHYLDPKTFHLLGVVGQRGPVSQETKPLAYRVGHTKEHLVRLKHAEGEPDAKATPAQGSLDRWRKVAVLHSHAGKSRLFVLEPSEETNELAWDGFFVKGNFEIVEKVNNPKAAAQSWEAFRAL